MTLEITRNKRWEVVVGDTVISTHNEQKEAYESAANYSSENNGVDVRVVGADFTVTNTPYAKPTTSSSSDGTPDEPVVESSSSSSSSVADTPEVSSSSSSSEPQAVPTIDISGIPDVVDPGDLFAVPVTGIAEDEPVYFHVFDENWGNVIASVVFVTNSEVEIKIPVVDTESRILQLQYNGVKEDKSITITVEDVVVEPEPEPEPTPDPDPQPEPTPDPVPGDGQTLIPGNGWTADTIALDQIGDTHEEAIARWNLVPYQIANAKFPVGVISEHLDGMSHVSISVNNGAWVDIHEEKYNAVTRCYERFAVIDPAQFTEDKLVELRAIAYPIKGMPILLPPNYINVNPNGTIQHEVIELDAGITFTDDYKMPSDRWLIVKPKPGVTKEQCVLRCGEGRWGYHRPNTGNIKYENVTWELPSGGKWQYSEDGATNALWVDQCDLVGTPETWWLCRKMTNSFYTDTTITGTQNLWHGIGSLGFVRHCHVPHVHEDVVRGETMLLHVTIDEINRREYTSYHSDFLQARSIGNTIMRHVHVKENHGQGIFPSKLTNCAFVDVTLVRKSVAHQLHLMGQTSNVLFKQCVFGNKNTMLRDDKGFFIPDGERIVFEDTPVSDDALSFAGVEYRTTTT